MDWRAAARIFWSKLGESWVGSARDCLLQLSLRQVGGQAISGGVGSTHRWWSTWPSAPSHPINHRPFKQCHATLLPVAAAAAARRVGRYLTFNLYSAESSVADVYWTHDGGQSPDTPVSHTTFTRRSPTTTTPAIFISVQPRALARCSNCARGR